MFPIGALSKETSRITGRAFSITLELVFIEVPRPSPSPGITCTDQCSSLCTSEDGMESNPSNSVIHSPSTHHLI